MKVVGVRSPGFGDRKKQLFEDYAVLTGAKVFSEDIGEKLENVKLDNLGKAGRIIVSKDSQ